MLNRPLTPSRRRLLKTAGASAALAALGAPLAVHAQAGPKIRIGYWPIAAGLPFYAAVELGYFKEAGLNVEALKFAGAQQVMEGMLSDRGLPYDPWARVGLSSDSPGLADLPWGQMRVLGAPRCGS